MRTIVLCLFLATTALAANGVIGKWRGTITTDNGQMPAYLELEQSGDKVTGLAGGS